MNKRSLDSKLARVLISFSMPLILSGLLQQLYNWADAFIVGNVEGELALAAIGATSVITSLFIMAITGFTSGISILSARYIRNEDRYIQNKILSSFTLVLGIIMTIISLITIYYTDTILLALQTPEEIFPIAKIYVQIILGGIPFMTVYNVYAAVLRGIGDSKMSFYAVLVSAITNVILDIVLVVGLRWGAEGAALATLFAQIIMTLYMVYYAKKKHRIFFSLKGGIFDRDILRKGSSLAVPITVQSVITSFGNLILQNFMNGFGTATVAAITTAYRIDTMLLLPVINLGTGISIIVSQNIGLGKEEEAKRSLIIGLKFALFVSIILTPVVVFFGKPMIEIFGVGQEAAQIGGEFFYNLGWFYFVFALSMAMRGYIEGKGEVLYSSINGLLSLVVRIVLSYGFRPAFGNLAIVYSEIVSWCFMFFMYGARLIYLNKIEKKTSKI